MNNKERISHEEGDTDAWVCICKNVPSDDGFYPCDERGEEVEPVEGWDGLYVCASCGRIINCDTLEVVGTRVMDWVEQGFIELTIADDKPFDRWAEEYEMPGYHVQIDDRFSFEESWYPLLLLFQAAPGRGLPRHRFHELFAFEGSKICHSPDRESTCKFLERFLPSRPEPSPITQEIPPSREQRVQSYLASVKRELALIE